MPAAYPGVRTRLAIHALVALCALTLLATAGGAAEALAGTPLGSAISSGRRSQAYYESVMLSQDRLVAGIKATEKVTRRALKQARKSVKRARRAHAGAIAVFEDRVQRLAGLEALHADTPEEEIPSGYADRVRAMRREVARARTRRMAAAKAVRQAQRSEKAREFRLRILKRQRKTAVNRREAAEGGLGAYIVRVTALARQRAEIQSSSHLAAGSAAFAWPAVGRIAQTYGCTGFRLNPRRGSCRHFHDGLDIVSSYGSKVRSAADGVVAYAGWNPWDEGGRAWIMVVSHPDGFVTRYGHLVPGSRVRVGRFVRQGEAIGRMGNTGKSTGTHLHFELLRGSSTVSPYPYLPDTMAPPRVTRFSGGDGGRKHKAAQRRKHKAQRQRDRRTAARRAEREAGSEGQAPGTTPDQTAETGLAAMIATAAGATLPDRVICTPSEAASDAADTTARKASGRSTAGEDEKCVLELRPAPAVGSGLVAATAADVPAAAARGATRGADDEATSGTPRPRRGTSPVPV